VYPCQSRHSSMLAMVIDSCENTKCIGNHKHPLCWDIEVFLEVPERKGGEDRGSSFSKAKVDYLQEGGRDSIVLDDCDEQLRGVESFAKKVVSLRNWGPISWVPTWVPKVE
jgi:hypothetical protein